METCNICDKQFKNLKNHQKNNKKCSRTTIYSMEKFLDLPKEVQVKCLLYLNFEDMWNVFKVCPNLFREDYNWCWKAIFDTTIKLPRKIGAKSWGIAYCKIVTRRCFNCFDLTNRIDHFYCIPMCSKCAKEVSALKCITKTTAKTQYCLSDKDLEQLDYLEVTNPHYRCASPAMLFLMSDVIKLANRKFKGKLEDEQKKRETKRQKMREKRLANPSTKKRGPTKRQIERYGYCDSDDESGGWDSDGDDRDAYRAAANRGKGRGGGGDGVASDIRKNELIAKLGEQGLVMRADSNLCSGYIYGTLDNSWNLEKIVDMVGEMKWLFEYTPYKTVLDNTVQNVYRDEHDYGNWGGRSYRQIFEQEEKKVRKDILKKYPKPDRWPWLGEEIVKTNIEL